MAKIGDITEVRLTNNRIEKFVITDIGDDWYRYDSYECIGHHCWNKKNSNKGGYPKSDLCKYVDNKLWQLIPEELRPLIIPTKRKYKINEQDDPVELEQMLFLPSASELFAEDDCMGDEGLYEQLEYYKDFRHRIRANFDEHDYPDWYWLASVNGGNSTNACHVTYYGYASGSNCSNSHGVPLCFRARAAKQPNLTI